MCLWFACFGLHKHRDDWDAPPSMAAPLPPPPATKPPHGRPPQPSPRSVYGGAPQVTYNYNGVHRASPHQAAGTAGSEAVGKASNDVRKGPAAHAAAEAPSKQPARFAGEAAGHGAHQHHYQYYEREPFHRIDAMDDYHYSTATATTDHERY